MTRLSRGDRILVGVAIGAASAVISYALVRGVERAFFPEPSPVVLIWSERSPLVWRSAIALYLGGAGVFGGYAIASYRARIAARMLTAAITAATLAIVLQAVLAP